MCGSDIALHILPSYFGDSLLIVVTFAEVQLVHCVLQNHDINYRLLEILNINCIFFCFRR